MRSCCELADLFLHCVHSFKSEGYERWVCNVLYLHLGLVVERGDLVLAAGHLLWIGACLLAQVSLIVCPERCARRVHGFALAYVHARQVLLPDLHMHHSRHDLCNLQTKSNFSALPVRTCLLHTLVCLRSSPAPAKLESYRRALELAPHCYSTILNVGWPPGPKKKKGLCRITSSQFYAASHPLCGRVRKAVKGLAGRGLRASLISTLRPSNIASAPGGRLDPCDAAGAAAAPAAAL